MSGSLAKVVMLLARCCLWLVKREMRRDAAHREWRPSDPFERFECGCECCQWANGIEADCDEAFRASEWRP